MANLTPEAEAHVLATLDRLIAAQPGQDEALKRMREWVVKNHAIGGGIASVVARNQLVCRECPRKALYRVRIYGFCRQHMDMDRAVENAERRFWHTRHRLHLNSPLPENEIKGRRLISIEKRERERARRRG